MPTCPVCGYLELKEPPRGASGGGSYEICPCCGFQFGVDDDDRELTYDEARKRWVAAGMPWFSKSRMAPPKWSAENQLKNLKEAPPKKSPTAVKKRVRKAPVKKTARKEK